jgi:LytTr DNA-binding domain
MMTEPAPLISKPIGIRLGTTSGALRRALVAVIWVGLLALSCVSHISLQVADLSRGGRQVDLWEPITWEVSSHLAILALLPALYWLDRRRPPLAPRRNLLIHLAAIAPFSLAHTLLMCLGDALAYWLAGAVFEVGSFFGRFAYELRKDALNYVLLLAVIHLIRACLKPAADPVTAPAPVAAPAEPSESRPGEPQRFAVRRDGREILVPTSEVARFESAGNYVVLHTATGRYDVRTTLAELERGLDPARFVRVHRSNIVQLDQIREIQPWSSGDFRLILRDGSQVNLSRRYRPRLDRLILAKG